MTAACKDILESETGELRRYITELRDIDKLHDIFRRACLDAAINKIPNIFEGFSYQDTYFSDTPCQTNLNEFFDNMSPMIGFGEWKTYSADLFCTAMCHHPELRKDVFDMGKLDSRTAEWEKRLNQSFYLHVKKYYIGHFFSDEWKWLSHNAEYARKRYIEILNSHIAIHELWYSTGQWNHPDLELYFHIIKLLQLGMREDEVPGLLEHLRQNGLTIPKSILGNNWRTYTGYMYGLEFITYSDLLERFSAKIKTAGDAEPIIRFMFQFAPLANR